MKIGKRGGRSSQVLAEFPPGRKTSVRAGETAPAIRSRHSFGLRMNGAAPRTGKTISHKDRKGRKASTPDHNLLLYL